MSDFPPTPLALPQNHVLSTVDPAIAPAAEIRAARGATASAVAGLGANIALFQPFNVFKPSTVSEIVVIPRSATPTGNFDVGIYDDAGARLVAAGATVPGANGVTQAVDITDTLLPIGHYYAAMVVDNTTQLFTGATTVIDFRSLNAVGVKQMASAYPLPSTATFAVLTASLLHDMVMTI